jgi:photosystem II stability/assembly factor-like uncharacterized protein
MGKFIKLSILLFLLQNYIFTQDGWFWQNPLPQGNSLWDIYGFDSRNAIAVGSSGTLMKTSDGGRNWNIRHNIAGLNQDLMAVHFLNNLTGLSVCFNGIIIKTTNSGESWVKIVH